MNKIFGRSKRSKEEKKKREEEKHENDFLYGRSKNNGRPAAEAQSTTSHTTAGGHSRKSTNESMTSHTTTGGHSRKSSSGIPQKRDTITAPLSESVNERKKNPHRLSGTSLSTSYYRGESSEAVSGDGRSESSPAIGGAHSRGDVRSSAVQYDRPNNGRKTEWDGAQSTSMATMPGMGGKTSGMTPEDSNQRPKEDRKARTSSYGQGKKSSFEERLEDRLTRSLNAASFQENDFDETEDEKPRRKSRKDEKHRHSHHSRRKTTAVDGVKEHRRRDRHEEETVRQEKDLQDGKDKKIKESIRQQRDAAKDIRATTQINRQNDADDEFEQRQRKQREQRDNDRKMKERIRQQGNAAKDLRASTQISRQSNAENEFEQRQRKQREQSDNDRKVKESIRQQRDAAKDLRASQASAKTSTQASAKISRHSNADDEIEQRQQRQREQSENDRKIKESIRQQTGAAKDHRAGAHVIRQSDADDEIEQRQRRQREQRDNDKKMKESIKLQRDAAKDLRASAQISRHSDVGYEQEQRQRRQMEQDEIGMKGKASFDEENENDHQDTFPADLQLVRGFKSTGQRETDQPDMEQNLIDLHLAQFRATTKTTTIDEEEYDEFYELDPNAALEEFEQEEAEKNSNRRMSRRVSATTMKINAWHQKYTLKKALELAERTPQMDWVTSFYRCDPRWQILKFFDEVAREGGEAPMDENLAASPLANLFNKANVFTVWRPTSDEAIKNMMLGIATGKGLDIKGKSAKKGNISSYVPFIQIYQDPHKEHVRALVKDGKTVRVFYQSEAGRNEALEMMLDIKDFMLFAAEDAMRVLSDEYADPAEQELAMKHLMYDDNSLDVKFVDKYINSSSPVYGLDITERLFWESYVMMQDCSRPPGSEWDIGRNSELTFMDMNFKAIRQTPAEGDPRPVVYQMSQCSPMEPRMLLMAYEEYGKVKPVVSDFDCFLLGSRGVKYEDPIPQDQIDLVKWSVKNISEVLDERSSDSKAGWMETWFKVLKKAALKGYYPMTPKYGNGDPKSYEIVEVAVSRLQETGCVRHGAECFNWFFPQEIDDEFLVISDTLPGNIKWKKMNVYELQDILITKIEEGFTFPINPKWVLCDPGWRRVYDKLLASQKPNVQDSIRCWLPPETGLREEIDIISARHPLGFEGTHEKTEGTEMMDQMQEDLERYLKIQRAWRKLRLVLFWIRFAREKRREREEKLLVAATASL